MSPWWPTRSGAQSPLIIAGIMHGGRSASALRTLQNDHVISKFRMLYFVRESYPSFRPDVEQLFLEELLSRGHRIDFVMQSGEDRDSERVRTIGTGKVLLGRTDLGSGIWHKIRRVALAFAHDFAFLVRVSRSNYDCIQFKDKFLVAAVGVLVARAKRIKFFFWLSFPFPEARKATARQGRFNLPLYCRGSLEEFLLYRLILPSSDHVFVQSARMGRDLQGRGISESKMTAVPMGVDLAQFEPARLRNDRAGATIGYLGTLGAERQLVVLIDMLDKLRNDFGLDANLLLVGDGNGPADRQILTQRASELGLEKFVRVTGFLPRQQALAELRAADVCISPFYPTPILLSTSPTKLIEYMALAIPVVANDHPEQSLVIEQSGAGLCVPWGAEPFAAAVAQIFGMSPTERLSLGQRGRDWVEQHRTYSKIADRVEGKYLSLLDRRGEMEPAEHSG